MGVKLKELLALPSLREAEVVAGKNGLNNTVTSLSFLEITNPEIFSEAYARTAEFSAGELVISSFYTVKEDLTEQLETIRFLHRSGHAGLLLYYVGIVLPELKAPIIALANELDFTIVQMPKNDPYLRYSEAIGEISSLLTSRKKGEHLVNEVLEKVSLLPEHLRSVKVALQMMSDYLRCNIVLTDADGQTVHQLKWPRNSQESLEIYTRLPELADDQEFLKGNFSVYKKEIYQKENGLLALYLIRETEPLTETECQQAVELLRVALNLWGRKHGEINEYALLQAILNEDSSNMYQLANALNLNVRDIQTMWVISLKRLTNEKALKKELSAFLAKNYGTYLVQLIEDKIVVLLGNYQHTEIEMELGEAFIKESTYPADLKQIVLAPRLRNTQDIRMLYRLIEKIAPNLNQLFLTRKSFSISEIRQVQQALNLIQAGDSAIAEILYVLEPILENKEHLTTLTTFLLDASADFQVCSELLEIHKNTVKYRIKKISELLGYNVTRFSESYECYLACMVQKLIHS